MPCELVNTLVMKHDCVFSRTVTLGVSWFLAREALIDFNQISALPHAKPPTTRFLTQLRGRAIPVVVPSWPVPEPLVGFWTVFKKNVAIHTHLITHSWSTGFSLRV